MTQEQEDQLVLDQAWDWLVRAFDFFDRRAFEVNAVCVRRVQLWRWNGRKGPMA